MRGTGEWGTGKGTGKSRGSKGEMRGGPERGKNLKEKSNEKCIKSPA